MAPGSLQCECFLNMSLSILKVSAFTFFVHTALLCFRLLSQSLVCSLVASVAPRPLQCGLKSCVGSAWKASSSVGSASSQSGKRVQKDAGKPGGMPRVPRASTFSHAAGSSSNLGSGEAGENTVHLVVSKYCADATIYEKYGGECVFGSGLPRNIPCWQTEVAG